MLAPLGWVLVPQADFAVTEIEETGATFQDNALLKARHAAAVTGRAALADDSGLEVDALDGAPGVLSARYADGGGDAANLAKLLAALEGVPPTARSARFRCVLALVRFAADPAPLVVEGVWEGHVATAPCGSNGFGYDPVFIVPGLDRTAAELDAATKNRISHRGQALARLIAALAR